MSRTESRTAALDFQNKVVLARAFGDEPLKLVAKAGFDGLVELALNGATVLFPERDVFLYEEGLFGQLRRAFEAGDWQLLGQLWSQARPVEVVSYA